MASETILNGRYALVAQQGSGGMSVIYRAVDRALGRTVAVKILRPSLTKDLSFLDKFRNEARSVANLSHPNIVTVHDVGSDGPTHYIVMEMIEGQDLKKIIKDNGSLPVERALHLVIQICAGIGYAHRSGLVHADVKPQNILVTAQDVVKVTDFGIAQALTDTQPIQQRAEVVWGSPHYFAPEQARGEQPTPASDVYAIGIVLFEMLTGRLPYTGINQQELALAHIRQPIPLVTEFNPTVPESLAKIVYKVMSKEPHDRYRDGDQLGSVLQKFREKAQSPFTSQTSPNAEKPLMVQPPTQRPPSINIPPAPSSDPTVRYSSAPHAPQPYDPRRPASYPAPNSTPTVQQPQPFEQRFTPPMPQSAPTTPYKPAAQSQYPVYTPQQPLSESGGYPRQYSQPMMPQRQQDEPDYVTIILAVLAVIAVVGLVPLWLAVLATRS